MLQIILGPNYFTVGLLITKLRTRVSIIPEQNFHFGNGMIRKFQDNFGSNGNQNVYGLHDIIQKFFQFT